MENKFTNKNTLDDAWSMMQTTLDQEMPVQKKRRAIWWIPLGVGLLALASWMYVFAPSNADTDTDTQHHEQIENTKESGPIASTEMISPSASINQSINTNKKETKSIKNKKSKTTSTTNVRLNKNSKATTKTTAPLKTKVSAQVNTIRSSVHLDPKAMTSLVMSEEQGEEELIVDQNQAAQSSSNMEVADAAIEDNLNAENLLAEKLNAEVRTASNLVDQLPLLHNQQFDWEVEPNIEVLKPVKNNWDIGLKTVYLTDFGFDSPTLLVEGQIIRKIKKRWSFISGLGIKSQRLRPTTLDAEGGFNPLPDISTEDNFRFFDFSDAKNSQFNFLYLPIAVQYIFKGRWSLDAGAHYNFLELANRSTDSIRFGSQHDASGSGASSFNAVTTNRSFFKRNLNHFSYFLSVSYKLGKKASVLVQYQGNTQKFSKGSEKIDAHQLGVGMHWQF